MLVRVLGGMRRLVDSLAESRRGRFPSAADLKGAENDALARIKMSGKVSNSTLQGSFLDGVNMRSDKGERIKQATDRKTEALKTKYLRNYVSERCTYSNVDDGLYTMRACGDEPVRYKVSFSDGTTLYLCDGHAKWYRSIHPVTIPLVAC